MRQRRKMVIFILTFSPVAIDPRRADSNITRPWRSRGDELLALAEQILTKITQDDIDRETYEISVTPFLGTGWHCLGAIMIAAIDRAGGLKSVLKMLCDPRMLLIAYNLAIEKVRSPPSNKEFDKRLAERIRSLGSTTRRGCPLHRVHLIRGSAGGFGSEAVKTA